MENTLSKMAQVKRLALLDGLRLVAAVSVVFYHAQLSHPMSSAFSRGYLFVDFFFLLSGFVLTLAAEDAMRTHGGAGRFVRGRIARLWPVIAIGAVLGAALRFAVSRQSVRWQLLQTLLLVPDLRHGGLAFPLNGPLWSMLLEVVANAIHALVLCRLADRAVLVVALVGGFALATAIAWYGSATFGPDAGNWGLGFLRIGFAYPLGIVLARRYRARPPARTLPWLPVLLLPLGAVTALGSLPLPVAAGDALVILLVFPPLLWLAAASSPPRHALPWLGGAGLLSFPLYAVHLPILEYAGSLYLGPATMPLGVIACLLAAAVVAQLVALPKRLPALSRSRPLAPTRPA